MGKGVQMNHYNKRMEGECHQCNGKVWDLQFVIYLLLLPFFQLYNTNPLN